MLWLIRWQASAFLSFLPATSLRSRYVLRRVLPPWLLLLQQRSWSRLVEAADYSAVQLALIVLATAAGSVFGSHVNDSGFWLVGRLMGMDVATTLRTWTLNQALVSFVGFVFVLIIFGITAAL